MLTPTHLGARTMEVGFTKKRSAESKKSDEHSDTTLINAEASGTGSFAGDPSYEQAATAESESSEKQSDVRGRWSIWNQYISHELSMPVRRKPPPEGVGPPASYTCGWSKAASNLPRKARDSPEHCGRE
ncbi:hypothetical protein MTO96_003961 [Rhipicephalus appendiculatus]